MRCVIAVNDAGRLNTRSVSLRRKTDNVAIRSLLRKCTLYRADAEVIVGEEAETVFACFHVNRKHLYIGFPRCLGRAALRKRIEARVCQGRILACRLGNERDLAVLPRRLRCLHSNIVISRMRNGCRKADIVTTVIVNTEIGACGSGQNEASACGFRKTASYAFKSVGKHFKAIYRRDRFHRRK